MQRFFTFLSLMKITTLLLAAESKPNFVFFLVDDFGYGDLGCYGAKFHETPNIDKLASEGMRFTQGYSACTVCSPSRAAIITGQYPARLHLTDWISGHNYTNPKLLKPNWKKHIDHDQVTFPEVLQSNGYKTQFLGKWHLMPKEKLTYEQHFPQSHGFDSNIGGREWGQPKGRGRYFSPFDMPGLDDGEEGDYLTDKLTDAAVEFIHQSAEEPFLLYFSYYTVHGPIMAKPELRKKYTAKAEGYEPTHTERVHSSYAGMVESLDQSVGRVLAKLEEKGIADNTIIIFTADNGGVEESSSGGLRKAKGFAYEGGTREPVIIKWPGHTTPGSTSNTPIIGTDFYPTILSMAGIPLLPEAHKDGLDISTILTGQTNELDRDALYWHYPHYHKTAPYGAIRKGDFKLIEFFEHNTLELYNLSNDPNEANNLFQTHPEKVQELYSQLKSWRTSVNAQMMTENPDYDPNQPTERFYLPKKPSKKNPSKKRTNKK